MLQVKVGAVGAYGELPYDEKIKKALSFVDRFDVPYELYRTAPNGVDMWVPRNCVGTALTEIYDPGHAVWVIKNNFVPRNADQVRVVKESHALLDQNVDFVLQAATGYGKTYLGAEMISYLQRRALVITTKEDIVEQWRKAVKDVCGLKDDQIGVWRGDHIPHAGHWVVIGLVQSIMKGPDRYPIHCFRGFGLTLVDEVHRMGAEKFNAAMWWVSSRHRVGLSATPYRKDGRERAFEYHIGKTLVQAKQDVMIPKVIAKATGWKVPMVHWSGEYKKLPHTFGRTMNLDVRMGKDKYRNRLITEFCKAAVAKGRYTVVFSSSIKHLHALHDDFVGEGISPHKIGWYVGLANYDKSQGDPKWQRETAKIKNVVLATYSMASEGTDVPWWDSCVLATPRSDVVQIVGRIRREWEGKKEPVVFDLVDLDSYVLGAYWKKRVSWYAAIGAQVIQK